MFLIKVDKVNFKSKPKQSKKIVLGDSQLLYSVCVVDNCGSRRTCS